MPRFVQYVNTTNFKCEPINTIVSLTNRPICDTYMYKHNKWRQYPWRFNILRKCHQELHLKELRKPPPRPRHREEETRKGARGGGNLTAFISTKSWKKHTRTWVFQRRLWVSWILSSMTFSKASRLANVKRSRVITIMEIQNAVRLQLPGELPKYAISQGAQAIFRYDRSRGRFYYWSSTLRTVSVVKTRRSVFNT